MKKKDDYFPSVLYSENLLTVQEINFTPREVDIMACLAGARGTSKIASLLTIAPKTVVNHIRNIMMKIDCNSREGIIDFLEKSNKLTFLRKYYADLILRADFDKKLKEVSKVTKGHNSSFKIIYLENEETHKQLSTLLNSHLEQLGLSVSTETRLEGAPLSHFLPGSYAEEYVVYILSIEDAKEVSVTYGGQNPSQSHNLENILFVLLAYDKLEEIQEFFHPHYVKLTNENSYYFSFFEILQKLHPNPNLQKIISSFKDFYDHSNKLAENSSLQTGTEIKNRERHKIPFVQAKYVRRFSKKTYILIALIISMGILSLAYIFFTKSHPTEQSKTLIRSDLILPKKATLLQRPELIKQISERFKNQKDIQTVALVGVGGAGKTILARQYAHEVKAPIMWEVNAESKTNLLISFKNLAYGFSKSEEDKKVLKEIEEIKAPHIREDKTILFVKEHLRLHPDWLLIYDNVENFTDLQKYFPNDPETWGEGKILITTKNANIEANIHINHIIPVGELREDQKIDLFISLVNDGKNSHLAVIQKEEILAFLNQIPPFPLDISVAAHYLKTVGVTYKKYLERLIHYDNNFAAVEKNLLKEAGEYTQTRHGIITLSLEHLMHIHQDFRDLLLLISCIGSQNISRELLDKCKPESVVDNFIYHLKKHSIIATTLSYRSEPSFSIHRSIQSIILEYFVKMLTLENKKNGFQSITNILESYATDLINKKEYIKLKKLSSHLEVLLSHNDLFSSEMSQPIRTKLGSIYFHLGYDIQAKYLLEDGLQNLHKKSLKNYTNIAQISTELGNIYLELAQYEKAKDILGEALKIYETHHPENYKGRALALRYLGKVYKSLGDYEKAKNVLEKSFSISRKYVSENPEKSAVILAYLGNIYRKLGNLEKAKDLLEESLSTLKKSYSKDHFEVARAKKYLGNVYKEMGYYTKSLNLLEEVLKIYIKSFGKDSIRVSSILSDVGSVCSSLGNFNRAQHLIEQSLAIYKKNYPEGRIESAHVLVHLGVLYKEMKNYNQAKDILKESLIIYERHYGKDHIETAQVLKNLGQVYLLENNMEAAENHFRKALDILTQNNHLKAYIALENISELYLRKLALAKNKEEPQQQTIKNQITENLTQALKIMKVYLPKDSPHIARIQSKINSISENSI